jgi:hypothetical protein
LRLATHNQWHHRLWCLCVLLMLNVTARGAKRERFSLTVGPFEVIRDRDRRFEHKLAVEADVGAVTFL